MKKLRLFIKDWFFDFFLFVKILLKHIFLFYLSPRFNKFEAIKGIFVGKLYQQRGKYSHLIVNSTVLSVMVLGVTLGPSLVVNESQTQAVLSSGLGNKIVFASEPTPSSGGQILGINTDTSMAVDTLTQVSDKPRSDVLDYTVQQGDTLSTVAKQFGLNTDSIKWENPGIDEKRVKPGTVLKIPPVDGVVITVKGGETIYSIAKKYNVSAQAIVDFPFNEFSNDETFALAIGQTLMVPDGIMPDEPVLSPSRNIANMLTPNAGAVSATGVWIWPAKGIITQYFKPWHKGDDIANHDGGPILAADSGTVVHAGWDNSGYGNMVMIDHGNGYKTVYGHMLTGSLRVQVGQTVKRGDQIGSMGSTGRSTGTHLHFEIRSPKGNVDPLGYLK
jgi:murein DD-endopeptidase MepM/ murein hydrolase activator NlpD